MMDYKSLMGYGKKKKVTKVKPKPKVNKVLESVKEEFGYKDTLNEAGVAQQHYKYIKLITKAEENMHKHIQEYKYFLQDQDLDREAKEIGSKYITMIGKFTHYLKTKWVKMIGKMI